MIIVSASTLLCVAIDLDRLALALIIVSASNLFRKLVLWVVSLSLRDELSQ